MKLENKVAVVTGGGSGIGECIAMLFAMEGAHVVILDIDTDRAESTVQKIRDSGMTGLAFQADVSRSEDVDHAVGKVEEELGAIHILVNNAGVAHPPASFLDLEEEVWRRVFKVNVYSQFIVTQRVARVMVKHRLEGCIVNITSGVLNKMPRHRTAYVTSKGAIAYFTKSAAQDLAENNIRINAIAPGMILTPMTEKYRSAPGEDADYMRDWTSTIPFGRWGTPEEIAAAALFLVSDEAGYMTGSVITIDGGFTIT